VIIKHLDTFQTRRYLTLRSQLQNKSTLNILKLTRGPIFRDACRMWWSLYKAINAVRKFATDLAI